MPRPPTILPQTKDIEGRLYNPVERPFFQTSAQDRDVIHHVGPYRNAFDGPTWLLSLTKAVNKRNFNNLLGVAVVGSRTNPHSHTLYIHIHICI